MPFSNFTRHVLSNIILHPTQILRTCNRTLMQLSFLSRSKAADVRSGERWEVWVMVILGLLVSVTGLCTDLYDFLLWLAS